MQIWILFLIALGCFLWFGLTLISTRTFWEACGIKPNLMEFLWAFVISIVGGWFVILLAEAEIRLPNIIKRIPTWEDIFND